VLSRLSPDRLARIRSGFIASSKPRPGLSFWPWPFLRTLWSRHDRFHLPRIWITRRRIFPSRTARRRDRLAIDRERPRAHTCSFLKKPLVGILSFLTSTVPTRHLSQSNNDQGRITKRYQGFCRAPGRHPHEGSQWLGRKPRYPGRHAQASYRPRV
jgi:hypothetical protein